MQSNYYQNMVPNFDFGSTIPKKIHHIFFGQKIPDILQNNINHLLAENQEYEHHVYTDANARAFVLEFYGSEVVKRFDRLSHSYPAIRSDFLRYLVVYARGGIYLDLKSLFTAPIAEAVNGKESFFLCQWCNLQGEEYENFGIRWVDNYIDGGDYEQWHVIAAKGHPFLRAVIIEVLRRIDAYRLWKDGTGRTAVFHLTGPHAYSDAIYPIRSDHPHVYFRRDEDAKLRYSCLSGMSHASLDKKHYSAVHSVLVEPVGHLKPLYFVFRSFQFVKRKLFRRF